MKESFDLNFFASIAGDLQKTKIGMEQVLGVAEMQITLPHKSRFALLNERELFLTILEKSDFVGFCLGIDDVHFTLEHFSDTLREVLEVVSEIFSHFPSIQFATAIYELTAYYLEDMNEYMDFDYTLLHNFPFLFLRERNQFGFTATNKYRNVWYIVNQGPEIQDIF